MANVSKRSKQVASSLQRAVSEVLQKSISDPRLQQLTITSVNISPDLRNATVYYVGREGQDSKGIQKVLSDAAGFVRYEVAKKVELRVAPKVVFALDNVLLQAEKLSSLLHNTGMQDEKDAPT